MDCSRFAPTTSGPAHPGTLLAALLCWLDARSRGAKIVLRLEDIDSTRCTPEHADDLRTALSWLGLDWDSESLQSDHRRDHEQALTHLAERGLLYPCRCTRSDVKRAGERDAGGGPRYPGTCRGRTLPVGGWQACNEVLRLRLEPGLVTPMDEGGFDLAQDPAAAMGDPVLRRKDGAIAYHLAVVVDDAAQGVTRVVRGHDLAVATATHVRLQQLLELPTPVYRHHLLLLEERGAKLAKLHGAVGWHALRERYSAGALCGLLACIAGLTPTAEPATPTALLEGFDWGRVRRDDPVLRWTGSELLVRDRPPTCPSS
jgi:glutamyl/glutaminyl-tRNA synthetase